MSHRGLAIADADLRRGQAAVALFVLLVPRALQIIGQAAMLFGFVGRIINLLVRQPFSL